MKSLDLGNSLPLSNKNKNQYFFKVHTVKVENARAALTVVLKFAHNMFKWHTYLRAWKEKKTKTQQSDISGTIVTTMWEYKSS